MSGLSWLIYLIGLSENVGSYFGYITVPIFLIAITLTMTKFIVALNYPADATARSLTENYGKPLGRWVILTWTIAFSLVGIYIIVPNKQTATLIAASEVGQRIIDSKAAESVGNRVNGLLDPSAELLETWIKRLTLDQKNLMDEAIKRQETKK